MNSAKSLEADVKSVAPKIHALMNEVENAKSDEERRGAIAVFLPRDFDREMEGVFQSHGKTYSPSRYLSGRTISPGTQVWDGDQSGWKFNAEGSFANGKAVTQAELDAAKDYAAKVLDPKVKVELAKAGNRIAANCPHLPSHLPLDMPNHSLGETSKMSEQQPESAALKDEGLLKNIYTVARAGVNTFNKEFVTGMNGSVAGRRLVENTKSAADAVEGAFVAVKDAGSRLVDNISGAEVIVKIEELAAGQRRYNNILATRLADALDRIDQLEAEVRRLSDGR